MTSKIKYLLYREGRYYARIVIPVQLRPYIENKTELRIPLGADRRAALRQHPNNELQLSLSCHKSN
jgi:hypothetical protein